MARNSMVLPGEAAICAAAAEWVARRDHGLTTTEEEQFRHWLEADPRHRAALTRFNASWTAFDRPRLTGAADKIVAELASRSGRRLRRLSVAACGLIALAYAGIFWHQLKPRAPGSNPPPASNAIVHFPARQVLADGSVVELDDGAQIAVDFTASLRRVQLRRGEALFEVTKNPARPFIVSAAGVEVRAVGTAFSVRLNQSDVEVLVTEGRVSIEHDASAGLPGVPAKRTGNPPTPQSAFVAAGNRLVMPVDAASRASPLPIPVTPTEVSKKLGWRSPKVEFSGTPLTEAVALLNRYAVESHPARLVVSDDALASMRVSGIFRADNTDAFVLLLEAGFGIKAERLGDRIILRKAR